MLSVAVGKELLRRESKGVVGVQPIDPLIMIEANIPQQPVALGIFHGTPSCLEHQRSPRLKCPGRLRRMQGPTQKPVKRYRAIPMCVPTHSRIVLEEGHLRAKGGVDVI